MINAREVYVNCGAELVSFDQLKQVHTTPKSPTHQPIAHYEVASKIKQFIEKNINFADYEIVSETYGLSHKGENCFSIFKVRNKDSRNDYDQIIIFRNSNNMGFSLRVGGGGLVIICSNMMFSSEYELEKGCKHTKNIMDTFEIRMIPLTQKLLADTNAMHKKYDHYKESILSLELTDHYICELMRGGAITKTKIDKVYNEFMKPSYRYDAHERSAWSLLNSVTHCNKGLGYVEQIRRTQRLHNVFDNLLAVA